MRGVGVVGVLGLWGCWGAGWVPCRIPPIPCDFDRIVLKATASSSAWPPTPCNTRYHSLKELPLCTTAPLTLYVPVQLGLQPATSPTPARPLTPPSNRAVFSFALAAPKKAGASLLKQNPCPHLIATVPVPAPTPLFWYCVFHSDRAPTRTHPCPSASTYRYPSTLASIHAPPPLLPYSGSK